MRCLFYFPNKAPKNDVAKDPPISVRVRVCITKPLFTMSDTTMMITENIKAKDNAFTKILLSDALTTPKAPKNMPSIIMTKKTILAAFSEITLKYTSTAPIRSDITATTNANINPLKIALKFIFTTTNSSRVRLLL